MTGNDRPARAIVIAGPTASDKSGLALAIAERFRGTVINADALQVYRELEILTARPGRDALRRAPHRLYGILKGTERCTAGRWRDLALAEICAAGAERRVPVVVGGTGLYLRALLQGLSPIPRIPRSVRARAVARLEAIGAEAFHRELAERDPWSAARLSPTDRHRMVRAWEILEHTGLSQVGWIEDDKGSPPPGIHFLTILLLPARPTLFERCDARFAEMIAGGAVAEARALMALGLPFDAPVMKAVGLAPLLRCLAGEISLDEARILGQRDTRRYAKRQTTWFKNQLSPDMLLHEQFSESIHDRIFPFISDFLLTPPS